MLVYFVPCRAQNGKTVRFDLPAMLANHSVKAVNRSVTSFSDGAMKGIRFNEVDGMGVAWLGTREFSDGVIEFDVRGKDEFQKSFVGVAFHGVNDTTFDAVYLRPFNFKTTDDLRRKHQVQYISMPRHDWFVLRDAFPGKYEQPVDPVPDPNGWVHVRVVIASKKVSVYIDRNPKPSLEVGQLEDLVKGKIGLWAGNGSAGDWANVSFTPAS